jgi:predicted Rossmann-fold nucleotide-binding protein
VIEKAYELGGVTIMFSPDKDMDSHQKRYDNHEVKFYNQVIYGDGFTARSLEMINSVDAALVLNGRTGTLCEFSMAVEEGLLVAVLTNTGGISDYLPSILKIVDKEFPSKIFFGDNYKKQIDLLLQEARNR